MTPVTSVSDGLTHLEPNATPGSWESDPAYIILRDDFVGFFSNGAATIAPTIGQLGWASVFTSGAIAQNKYYVAGNMGVLQMGPSSTTSSNGYSITLGGTDSVNTSTMGFPLAYVAGWQAEFVFRWPKFATQSAANPTTAARLYIGFASAAGVNNSNQISTPRPAGFIGLRYDTDPQVWTLSAAGNAAGGVTTYTGTITFALTDALVGQSFTVAGFVAHPGNNGTFVCTANTTTSITLNNAAGVAETQAATATGTPFSDSTYNFEVVQNGTIGSNIQGTVINSGVSIDNNWHRFRMRSLVPGTVLFSIDGGAESSIAVGVQTLTAGSNSGQGLQFTQELHSGGLQTTDMTQNGIYFTGGSACPGTPLTLAGLSGSAALLALNGTWNVIEFENVAAVYFDTSSISSNTGGTSSTGTATFYNAFSPFIMLMNDTSGSGAVKRIMIDFFSFVWNPGLSTAGGTPLATNPRGW